MKKQLLLTFFALFLSFHFTSFGQVCGGIFTDPQGPSANYLNNADYTVTINPVNPGEKVTVTFTSFDTEATWDALYVFDGPSTTSPQIISANPAANVPGGLAGGFWGTAIPGPFTSTHPGGSLTFRFRSDNTQVRAGWIANVSCALPPTCPVPTLLNVTNITDTSVTLGWTSTNATTWEVIALPCTSPAPTATTTGYTTTTSNPYVFTNLTPFTCYNFYVRSVCSASDSSVWSLARTATTMTSPPVCGGNFVDPGGPTVDYSNNTDSTTIICPTIPGYIVTVSFTTFNVEATWDALYVFDGNSTSAPQIASANPAGNVPGGLAGGFWGTAIPGPFTSTADNGCLTFRFRTDDTATRPGWIANVICNAPPTCPKPINLIASGGTTSSMTLNWTNMSTATSFEVVALPCNSVPNASTVGTVVTGTSHTFPGLSSSTCYSFFVRALCSPTDWSIWSNPTSATTLTIPPVCGGFYKDNGGTNAAYLPNSDSSVTICPTIPGQVVTVTFSSFDVQADNDALYVFDGDSFASPQLSSNNSGANVPGGLTGGYWGTTAPGPFTSTDATGCLTFRFRSDATINNAGWSAAVTCGPSEDKILLVAFVDQNNNGVKDTNESFYSHGTFLYQQNNTGSTVEAYSPVGRYALFDSNPANTYDFTYQVHGEFATYYSSGSTSYNDISVAAGSGVTTYYFPVTLLQTYNDVSISIAPVTQPRPGLTYINKIIYRNTGMTAASGTITFTKPTPVSILTISQTGTVAFPAGFTYSFSNLLPNETRFIYVTMSVPSSPTVVANTLFKATADITAPSNDINTSNNAFSLSQITTNSFDPNDKMEAHGDKIPINQFTLNDYLYYTVRFQNTGTANAVDLRIQDVLHSKIDETSIRMVSASHSYTMTRVGTNVAWFFDNIQLVPSSASPELSSGYVNFKVKLKPGYVVGDIVPNNASIVFDSNPPIVTNTFNTKFIAAVLSSMDFAADGFIMYPNPASEIVSFSMEDATAKLATVSVTDILGKTVRTLLNIDSNTINVDISDLRAGIYLVEITSDDNLKTTKKLVIN